MQIIRGRGKLYDSRRNYLGGVTYEVMLKSGGAEWRGEITPDNGIMPVGDHILELADGRRGPGTMSIRTNSSFGLVTDSYDITGTGPLTTPKE